MEQIKEKEDSFKNHILCLFIYIWEIYKENLCYAKLCGYKKQLTKSEECTTKLVLLFYFTKH